MRLYADFHIHGRFSRGTSKNLTVSTLEKYARIKGVNLLGTGDFTHPEWLKELKKELAEDGAGILKTKSGFPFLLQTELSFIYSQDGRGRRVHNIVLAPSFEVVEQINEALLKHGRLDYDGRPIFGISCIQFMEEMLEISKDIEIVPAHIFTPWFSLFGSKSGFDTVKDCFGEYTKHIHALETGLSSDPAMNWRLSQLDKYTLVSNSDAHSFWPWRLGRECNLIDLKSLAYKSFLEAIREKKGFVETIEVDPNYGKYHLDGHRACDVCFKPEDSKKNNNMCPKCGKELTIGVLHRVEELADRPEGFKPKNAIPFRKIIPLHEIISGIKGSAMASKSVWAQYNSLIKEFGSEMNILLDVDEKSIRKVVSEKLADAILKNRAEEIKIVPGYDGVYGVPVLEAEKKEKQKGLINY